MGAVKVSTGSLRVDSQNNFRLCTSAGYGEGWLIDRERCENNFRRRTNNFEVGDRGVVALTFDHGTTRFSDLVFPALQERELTATLALCSDTHLYPHVNRDKKNQAPLEEIKSWANAGIEIANHSATHKAAVGFSRSYYEIVYGRNNLERLLDVRVDSWVQPGYHKSGGSYDGFGVGTSLNRYQETIAGRLILKEHACITGMVPTSTYVHPIDGTMPIGTKRLGYDSGGERLAAAKNAILFAAKSGGRTINFCHPHSIARDSSLNEKFVKQSDFLRFLDFVVGLRDAGQIEVGTLRQWSVATKTHE